MADAGDRAFAVSLVFALLGLGLGLAAITTSAPLTVGGLGIAAVAAVFVVAVGLTSFVLRRHPRRWSKLAATLLPFAFGAVGVGAGPLMLVNRHADGPAEERRIEVAAHREHTRNQQSTYHLSLAPFPPLDEPFEVQVDPDVYQRCSKVPRQQASAWIGRGRLGWPYVVQRWGTAAIDCASP